MKVVVTGASGQIGYILCFMIAQGRLIITIDDYDDVMIFIFISNFGYIIKLYFYRENAWSLLACYTTTFGPSYNGKSALRPKNVTY